MSRRTALALALALTSVAGTARALDPVAFGTDWKAEPGHGGFYHQPG